MRPGSCPLRPPARRPPRSAEKQSYPSDTMWTATHPPPSTPPLAAAGPREGSATRLSPIEGDGSQLSVPRLSGGVGSNSRHGVASTLFARLDQQLNLGMDQTRASGPDAHGSPTCSPPTRTSLTSARRGCRSSKRSSPSRTLPSQESPLPTEPP